MQPNQHICGFAKHMRIGHDYARRFNDKARPSGLDERPPAAGRFALVALPRLFAPFGRHAIARRHLNAHHCRDHALSEIGKIRQAALRNARAAGAKGGRQKKRGAARKLGFRHGHGPA